MDYKQTLNLPETAFPMRGNLPQTEPGRVQNWETAASYHAMVARNEGKPRFILHDGPPYANGHIHSGTVLNKILKDFVVKYRNMTGYQCEFRPGWDCHGLPIENMVEKEEGKRKEDFAIAEFRVKCRNYALRFMGVQRDEFKRLGVLADWDNPYLTLQHVYEETIAREFGKVVSTGALYKQKKPVLWCAHHSTALADAEVEYEDLTSPSIYVKFALGDEARSRIPGLDGSKPAFVVIWTTTPWTLPANLAVTLHPELEYVAADIGTEIWVVAKERLAAFAAECGLDHPKVVGSVLGEVLERTTCRHPFIERDSLFILGDFVTTDTGTGCVHTAPGHGADDYEAGKRYGLDIYAPVDDRGRFTSDVPEYQGRMVFECDKDIIAMLQAKGVLIKASKYAHSYPVCQRCKRPIVFRATAQWFVSMDKTELRQRALEAITKVNWIPGRGLQRIEGMLQTRPDWCLSRQRLWGLPIVAFTCRSCGEVLLDREVVDFVADIFATEGADAWYTRPVSQLIPPGTSCQKCGHGEFERESDILDVWFESGVSYAAVIEKMYGEGTLTDLYLEGSDQHRGWFQSTLLESVMTRGQAPYKTVLTHGFVVDGEGKKISKTLGNYIPPEQIIKKYGAEIYRLWVAAQNYQEDIRISDEILQKLVESYMKLRNTFRYLLGNLHEFDPNTDLIPVEKLVPFDRFMLHRFAEVAEKLQGAYESYKFYELYQTLMQFLNVDLSALYLDANKDRLYVNPKKSLPRESARTVMYHVLSGLVKLLAPVVSFTAEEVWACMPKREGESDSIFCNDIPGRWMERFGNAELSSEFEHVLALREVVKKRLEELRVSKVIGHSLDSKVLVQVGGGHPGAAVLQNWAGELREIHIVSQMDVVVVPGDGLEVVVERAVGEKCVRCWNYAESTGLHEEYPGTCARCAAILNVIKETHG